MEEEYETAALSPGEQETFNKIVLFIESNINVGCKKSVRLDDPQACGIISHKVQQKLNAEGVYVMWVRDQREVSSVVFSWGK